MNKLFWFALGSVVTVIGAGIAVLMMNDTKDNEANTGFIDNDEPMDEDVPTDNDRPMDNDEPIGGTNSTNNKGTYSSDNADLKSNPETTILDKTLSKKGKTSL